jgi:lysophospholipase L1-like esterase
MEPCREDWMRARMQDYVDVCHKLAAEYDVVLVDLQATFDEYFKYRHSSYIAWDRIHPNQIGATVIAREFLKHCDFDYDHVARKER